MSLTSKKWYLRHVGLLGAVQLAIFGLKDIDTRRARLDLGIIVVMAKMRNLRDKTQLSAIVVLESLALTCRKNAQKLTEDHSDDFAAGLQMAYLDVLSVLVEEAEIHGVPLSAIGLAGYDPYKDPALHSRRATSAPPED